MECHEEVDFTYSITILDPPIVLRDTTIFLCPEFGTYLFDVCNAQDIDTYGIPGGSMVATFTAATDEHGNCPLMSILVRNKKEQILAWKGR